MKINVKVAGQVFEVEIDDLHARPVIARIGADQFEVWPEQPVAGAPAPGDRNDAQAAPMTPAHANGAAPSAAALRPATPALAAAPAPSAASAVLAPLPGVLISLDVQAGDDVTAGQQLCVLEAMKMNNPIRAARAGRIKAVRAAVGQHVTHRQVLLEYEPG